MDSSPDEAFRLSVSITCSRCDDRVDGTLMFSGTNQIVDSEGFMVFATGALCDTCIEAM